MSARDFDTALASVDRDGRLLALMEKINRAHTDEIAQLHRELAELRDAVLTLASVQSRDVAALRESIRATDRVLADRTSHLA